MGCFPAKYNCRTYRLVKVLHMGISVLSTAIFLTPDRSLMLIMKVKVLPEDLSVIAGVLVWFRPSECMHTLIHFYLHKYPCMQYIKMNYVRLIMCRSSTLNIFVCIYDTRLSFTFQANPMILK